MYLFLNSVCIKNINLLHFFFLCNLWKQENQCYKYLYIGGTVPSTVYSETVPSIMLKGWIDYVSFVQTNSHLWKTCEVFSLKVTVSYSESWSSVTRFWEEEISQDT